jgi:hypothetical protein
MSSTSSPGDALVGHFESVARSRRVRAAYRSWSVTEPRLAGFADAAELASSSRESAPADQDRIVTCLFPFFADGELAQLAVLALLARAMRSVVAGWRRAGVTGGELEEREAELTDPVTRLRDAHSDRPADMLEGIAHTDSRELSGIFSTADSLLSAYRTDAALRGARNPNFDPADFATSRDTIYLVSPAATQSLRGADRGGSARPDSDLHLPVAAPPTGALRPREVANIAPLRDLPSTLAEGGSQGLIVLACLQDLSQARARWGSAADWFLTMFTHKTLLAGIADPATEKAVSTLAGYVDVVVRSNSQTNRWPPVHSTSYSARRQPRLPETKSMRSPPVRGCSSAARESPSLAFDATLGGVDSGRREPRPICRR